MILAAPWLALILLCTLVPLLLVLWILRLRRARVKVSAHWLWTQATDDLRAEVPFKKLRWSVLLALQLIALALLILAAAQPRVTTTMGRGGRTVLLVDVSASMSTIDAHGGLSRLEAAKAAALQAVDRLHPAGLFGGGGRTMVMTLGAVPRIVQPFTDARALLLRAIDAIEPTHEPGRIAEAITLAQAWSLVPDPDAAQAAPETEAARLEVFSDGLLEDLESAGAELDEPLVLHRVGSLHTLNRAVAAVGATRNSDDPALFRPWASVLQWGDESITVDVRLLIDGVPVAVRRVDIPAAQRKDAARDPGRVDVLFPAVRHGDALLLRAELVPGDALEVDDVARAIIPAGVGANVRLLGDSNALLQRAVAAMGLRMDPDQPDLVVAALSSTVDLGQLPSLSFGAPPASTMVHAQGKTGPSQIISADPRHPVGRGSRLTGTRLHDSFILTTKPGVRVLAQSTGGPVVVAWRERGVPRVHVGFLPGQSSLPLTEDFITLLVDAQAWLMGRTDERERVRAGDMLEVSLPAGVDEVEVRRDGRTLGVLSPPDPSKTLWGPASLAGVHSFHWSYEDRQGVERVVVDVPVRAEGDVDIGDGVFETDLVQVQVARQRSLALWPIALMAALLTLLAEWWVWSARQ
jgi:hypothetical protein